MVKPERIGNIAMPITASCLHAGDDMMIGRLGASISRGGACPMLSIWSWGLNPSANTIVNHGIVMRECTRRLNDVFLCRFLLYMMAWQNPTLNYAVIGVVLYWLCFLRGVIVPVIPIYLALMLTLRGLVLQQVNLSARVPVYHQDACVATDKVGPCIPSDWIANAEQRV